MIFNSKDKIETTVCNLSSGFLSRQFPVVFSPFQLSNPLSSSNTINPFPTSLLAAILLRFPPLQYTATGLVFFSFATFVSKSVPLTSMFIAPGIWPAAYSCGVRTSTSCTPFLWMVLANSSLFWEIKPLFWEQHIITKEKKKRIKVKKRFMGFLFNGAKLQKKIGLRNMLYFCDFKNDSFYKDLKQ